MKEIKAFKSALDKASNDAAHFMTAHLRAETHASGWPTNVTRSMRVVHNKGSFEVHASDSHKNAIHNLEYGTPDERPTAAMRRYSNRTQQAEKFFVGRLSKIFGEV